MLHICTFFVPEAALHIVTMIPGDCEQPRTGMILIGKGRLFFHNLQKDRLRRILCVLCIFQQQQTEAVDHSIVLFVEIFTFCYACMFVFVGIHRCVCSRIIRSADPLLSSFQLLHERGNQNIRKNLINETFFLLVRHFLKKTAENSRAFFL